ncbi:hypothetical protein AB0C96_30215 [Streptomyces sp. NPDC048506]|uniref:hypothetical protein n=1 Tax=Streptomyces sp. NPDC048506 TaxID=3155028 RepID=UPI00342C00A1
MTPTGRSWRQTAGVAALVLAAAGCGIRGTSVPVDAGGAPSRVSCKAPSSEAAPGTADGKRAAVYLVCGSALAQVERPLAPATGTGSADPRVHAARALLQELQRTPSPAEETAGFSSALPADLKVDGPRPGDPADALRLSIRPDDLPSFALAQLVCTYGTSPALGRTHAAVLGGPGSGDRTHRYDCSADVLANPDIAENAGWGDPLSDEG